MRRNLKKVLMYLIPFSLMIFCMVFYGIATNYVTYINNSNTVYRTDISETPIRLIDTWNNLVGSLDRIEYPIFYNVIDYLPWFCAFLLSITVLINIKNGKENFIIHIFFAEAVLIFMNGLVHSATILPDSHGINEVCNDRSKIFYGKWILYPTNIYYCGDMLWSGHTYHITFFLIFIFWLLQCHETFRSKPFKISYCVVSTIIVLFEMNFLVIFNVHYSIDVLIAAIVVLLLLSNQTYHNLVTSYKDMFNFDQSFVLPLTEINN